MHSQSFKYAHQTAANSVSIFNAKNCYIQYHMHLIASTHIDLPTILIHQSNNTCIVNHSSMHIKQPQIVLASVMYKHGYIHYHMYSTASTHIDLRTIINNQSISMYSQSFKYAHQRATNSVSIYIAQTCLHTISHAFHSLNSY